MVKEELYSLCVPVAQSIYQSSSTIPLHAGIDAYLVALVAWHAKCGHTRQVLSDYCGKEWYIH
jgi:hypothetical protein